MHSRIEWTAGACIVWALLLLVLPLRLLLSAAAAALVHEMCHALAIRALGGQVVHLKIGAGGMVMQTLPMTPWRELLCTLAGPCGSFLLVMLCRPIPEIALCALAQGCFNMLPIYPLDGGRILRCAVAAVKNTLQSGIFRCTIGKE